MIVLNKVIGKSEILLRPVLQHVPAFRRYSEKKKYAAELAFKASVVEEIVDWYLGRIKELYGTPCPTEAQRIIVGSDRDNAILTYAKLHQEPIYLSTLECDPNTFAGCKLLDIGSSAIPSALAFQDMELYCLEPLLPDQLRIGYPFWAYEKRVRFIYGFSEKMPFPDDFFDAAISVNALDHVDDFSVTAQEIKRVTKPGAKLRFHLHFHKATTTEPIELTDEIVSKAFGWCPDFRKVSEFRERNGIQLNPDLPDEVHTIWSNFE